MSKVKVERQPGTKAGEFKWRVTCGTCVGEDVWAYIHRPFIVCHAWPDAMWWAGWHQAEHDRLACPCCDNRKPLPTTEVLDPKGTVKVGDRLFGRTSGGWAELVAATA